MKKKVTIIGAGIAGCFLAILFAKRGYKVAVYERILEREIGSEASKRSFALTMYGYGIAVLKEEKLWDSLSSIFIRMEGSITQIGQTKDRQPIVERAGTASFYSVSRAKLLEKFLIQAKKYSSITFYFGKEFVSIDKKKRTIQLLDVRSKKKIIVVCDVIFGADGVNSKVRELLQVGPDTKQKKEYSGWSYKQVLLSHDLAKKMTLRGNFSQNWTRKKAIFVAYPNQDTSYSGMFILPQNNTDGFSSLTNKKTIKIFLKKYFPDFMPALSEITDAFLNNPEGLFVTVSTKPWHDKNFIAILGDSAHAFPPFYGQGVSAAFADSMTLIRLVEKYGKDWKKIFPLYQKERKKNTDALADLSNATLQNYRREKRADYAAIYAKLESMLHNIFPKFFHTTPFVRVAENQQNAALYVKLHKRQREIARYLGIPLFVAAVTGIVAVHETIIKFYKNSKRK